MLDIKLINIQRIEIVLFTGLTTNTLLRHHIIYDRQCPERLSEIDCWRRQVANPINHGPLISRVEPWTKWPSYEIGGQNHNYNDTVSILTRRHPRPCTAKTSETRNSDETKRKYIQT